MSRLAPNQLTVRRIETLKDGAYSDGGNLWVTIAGSSRVWSVRFTSPISGKRREMGLGPCRDVSLSAARVKAAEARRLIQDGLDPIDHRKEQKAAHRQRRGRTFKGVATLFIDDQKAGWSAKRAEEIWTRSLVRQAYPLLGEKPVQDVTTDHVLEVLRPLWATIPDSADRLRSRIERILDYAVSRGWRKGENPARWRGHLANILPAPSTVAPEKHHGAVAYHNISAVMGALAVSKGTSALAVRFACLTGVRSGEVRGASWAEIDEKAKLWVIPAARMKMKRDHRIPLSEAALAVLTAAALPSREKVGLMFPGGQQSKPLSDVALSKALHLAAGTKEVTVHGLRSTFRDWTAEQTDFPRDVAEMALAHAIGNKVEAAYRRRDLFDKRRQLMEAWGEFAVFGSRHLTEQIPGPPPG